MATLRAVTHRLTTTPVDQLPSIASFLATSLSDCAELLAAPSAQKGKSESDNAVQVHKLKTRLASLLQDRSVEGRWAAVVLVKATVEAGQWEIVRGYEPIVRSLIGILAKPDPISTRKMCIITLTRIFHLTYQYPTLVREITTPHLPGFITAALNLVSVPVKLPSGSSRKPKPNTPFLETVLHALLELIARHPTIFRPFGSQLRALLAEVIGCSSPVYFPAPVVDAAEQLLVSLHKCAPKDKSGSGWSDDCKSTILSIHRATDRVFRAAVEQWESVDPTLTPTRQDYSQELREQGPDNLGLPGWRGIHSGADRLVALLQILSGFVSMPSASAVALPLGSILDVTSRLTSVTVPPEGTDVSQSSVQFNLQIGREEREMLWTELPRIHIACLNLLAKLANMLETSGTSIIQTMLDQAVWVFRNEKFNRNLRSAVYDLLRSLVSLNGAAMTKQSVASIANTIRFCCHDLASSEDSSLSARSQSDLKSKSKAGQATSNADSFLNPELQKNRSPQSISRFPELQQNASALLHITLASIPMELLAPSVRAEIDRTIILTANKDAMLASVLNPVPVVKGRAGSSIMPFLVRSHADQLEVEALVRPRMPVLMTAPEVDDHADIDEADEADELAEEAYNTAPKTAEFLKQPASTLTQTQNTQPSMTPNPVASLHKRSYAEEPPLASSGVSFTALEKDVQAKKARFEDSPSSNQHQQSSGSQPSVAATTVHVSAPQPTSNPQTKPLSAPAQNPIPAHVPSVSAAHREQKAPSQPTAAPAAVDDSDDELPTLNMEPDTDDEEDDDDVTMEG
ncbi:hypothetical protein NUU61_001848 [Penicillium alfredii]|uniref:Pre-rRNA-processing protein RIX1 n=1 Tax=Penicillium alfredii TaxID=1506179 RepID=A0A9W9FQG1_9EURO|nr:uncharacterized protein NUU61_001848 [Penicillium alfredii]KAJ5104501.1 hypothetical protein NUU61_001848 [Penicillium alfredii]